MIRVKVKHLAWILLSGIVLIVAGQSVISIYKGDDWWGRTLVNTLLKSELGVDDAFRAVLYSEQPLDERIIYVGVDHFSMDSGALGADEMSLDDQLTRLEDLLARYPENEYKQRAQGTLASLYMKKHQWDDAIQLYEQLIEEAKVVGGDGLEWKQQMDLIRSIDVHEGRQALLSGRVMVGDQPLVGVQVYLRDNNANSYHIPPRYQVDPVVMTDDQGEFRFYDIAEGSYDIGIAASAKELKSHTYSAITPRGIKVESGKTVESVVVQFNPNIKLDKPMGKTAVEGEEIELEWDAYPGTAYYKLLLSELRLKDDVSGYQTFTLDQKILDPELLLNVEELRAIPFYGMGIGHSGEDRETWVYPSNLLGYAYPGSQYIWSIEAYDSEDRLLSSSRPLRIVKEMELPLISFEEKAGDQVLEGDRLIRQGKYDQAKLAYEAELQSNGNHDRELRILANLYYYGIKDFGATVDMEKALFYWEEIKNPTHVDLTMMEQCYKGLGMKTREAEVRKQIEAIERERDSLSSK